MPENIDDQRTNEWIARLQASGHRTTTALKVIVRILATSQRVLSPLEIYDLVRGSYPKVSLVTIYRTVEKLEEMGLIQRVHQPSGCQAFVATTGDHQHILICENCGQVEFFSGDKLEPLMSSVASETGYRIRDHWLQLFGFCTKCQSKASASGLISH
jgi:Fe2+ or Zn2+ uptake regulation protein